MNINTHLIEKISNCLSDMGLKPEVIDGFEDYIEDNKDENQFYSILPRIDMNKFSPDIIKTIVSTYNSLMKYKVSDINEKFLKILFYMGQKSVIKIMWECEPYPSEDLFNKLAKYNVDTAVLIAYYGNYITSGTYRLRHSFVNFYDKIYEKNKDAFTKAFELSEINESLIIATYIVSKEGRSQKPTMKWAESVLINSIDGLFDGKISEADSSAIGKYLKGGLFVTDKTIEHLKNNPNKLGMDDYLLKLLIGTSYIMFNESEFAKRFIKFTILFDYNKTLEALYQYLHTNMSNRIGKIMDSLNIGKELYIAWMGNQALGYNYSSFKDKLKSSYKENKLEFIKAIPLCTGINGAFMASMLWAEGEGREFISLGEEAFIDEFSKLMISINIDSKNYKILIDYLNGQISYESIKDYASNIIGKQNVNNYYSHYNDVLFWLKGMSEVFERGIKLFIAMGNADILDSLCSSYIEKGDKYNLDTYIEFLKAHGAVGMDYMPFIAKKAYEGYEGNNVCKEAKIIISKMIDNEDDEIIECIGKCTAETRAKLLKDIFNKNKAKNAYVLLNYIDDVAKVVKETIIELLKGYEEFHGSIIPLLSAKKQGTREIAIKILLRNQSEEVITAIRNAYEVEKNEKIKVLLRDILSIENSENGDIEELDITEYCKKALKGNRMGALSFLEFDSLPKVRFKDSEKVVEDEVIKYILLCYSSKVELSINIEAKKVSELLNDRDMAELALEVLGRWINNGAESKKKWVLPLITIHGDYRVITLLKKYIEEWPQNSRGAIASEAVRALALNGSNEALIIVDNISRKFKFRQVKEAAATALDFAAQQMQIDREELSDRIVPDLEFDIRGERLFDYGERKFTARLTSELTLEVFDEADKKIKTLPSPGKKDDEVKANLSLDEYKLLKKQLKSVAGTQTLRLEMALSENRKWTKDAWVKLFVENPIMHQFASCLIWGNYSADKLINTFRYMEDGSFNTMDEEEYILEEDISIGVIHPVELSKEEIDIWKEQLENYEIKQPFAQLEREVYRLTDEESSMNNIQRFGGITMNGLSLLGKLTGFGWYKGSIQDGGCYGDFYKESKTQGIGIQLSFSGMGVGAEDDIITIYDLMFYKAGTVARGSYVYDSVKENNIIKPKDICNRLFSETLYQVSRATASRVGFDNEWKKK